MDDDNFPIDDDALGGENLEAMVDGVQEQVEEMTELSEKNNTDPYDDDFPLLFSDGE